MPIEVYINPKENPDQKPHVVMPGGYATLSDFTEGEEHKLGIHCLRDGSGGEIFYSRLTDLPETPNRFRKGVASPLFLGKNRVGSIGPNQQTDRVLIAVDGKALSLVLRHALNP